MNFPSRILGFSFVCVVLLLVAGSPSPVPAQPPALFLSLRTESARAQAVQTLRERAERRKIEARSLALRKGWTIRSEARGRAAELMAARHDRPLYLTTYNREAAISTGVSLIRNQPSYGVTGAGLIAGIWDGGTVRSSHVEFGSRVVLMDSGASLGHSTHVAGTIGAAGIDVRAQGMAPGIGIHSYDWDEDLAEVAAVAATAPRQSDRIFISNHSYGIIAGWDYYDISGNLGWHWFGPAGGDEDPFFGIYGEECMIWDTIAHDAPYLLVFKAAGNDRGDVPTVGNTFYYLDSNGDWKSGVYDPAQGPPADGHPDGYDSIPFVGNSKNILTIGAVNDAVSGGLRSVASATMASFSGWGPTDDGRIKPDLVANGVNLYSTWDTGDSNYSISGGTSMATPNAAGSAALLIELYRNRFSNQDMRAATLKGLLIHTADDLGGAGPDYQNGWGLVNVKAAADLIESHAQAIARNHIQEATLASNQRHEMSFRWDAVTSIRATLSWTDPPGPERDSLDDTRSVLVNDLDLRIAGPDGTVYLPYAPDPANPGQVAGVGDNVRDNVEQVYFAAPPHQGTYTVTITHKGSLSGGSQDYSLLLTGQGSGDLVIRPAERVEVSGPQGGPFTPIEWNYLVENEGATSLTWQVETDVPWLVLSRDGGALTTGSSLVLFVTLSDSAVLLAAGPHTGNLFFSTADQGRVESRSVTLLVRPAVSLAWSPIPTPQEQNTPFFAILRAVDSMGETVTAFNGEAELTAFSGAQSTERTIGQGTNTCVPPIQNFYEDARTQVIYRANELGDAARFTALSLDIAKAPDEMLFNWTIRIKHTFQSSYDSQSGWEAGGWTVVHQSHVDIDSLGRIVFEFDPPFDYNGVDNLLIDFSHNNPSGVWGYIAGEVRCTTTPDPRVMHYRTDSEHGDPLAWDRDLVPFSILCDIPNIFLTVSGQIPLSGQRTVTLRKGYWNGLLTIPEVGDPITVSAADKEGRTGSTNVFVVETNPSPPRSESWVTGFDAYSGWDPTLHLRLVQDVTGDGRGDLVAFGDEGVIVAPSSGSVFEAPALWVQGFGARNGWQVGRHPRFVSDVNGDGRGDLVGFGDRGVTAALSNGAGFDPPALWTLGFGYEAGWRAERHPRLLADVNGDGLDDLVGFGDRGVTVALSTGASFSTPALWTPGFGYADFWRIEETPRVLADVNGDGMADVLGFGSRGLIVSLSTGSQFATPTFWRAGFGARDGWTPERHLRLAADVNGDGMADAVGFGDQGVMVSLSEGNSFAAPAPWSGFFGYDTGWRIDRHIRLLVDMNGDDRVDIIGFFDDGVILSLAGTNGFFDPAAWVAGFGYDQGWRIPDHPRILSDVDGDGAPDIVGFGDKAVEVY
ncbi:S8 family serine peptidase [bacterium]|nr:S8 family serine peptidase [bacterium]